MKIIIKMKLNRHIINKSQTPNTHNTGVFASSSGLLAGAWLELGCGWGNGWLVLRDG